MFKIIKLAFYWSVNVNTFHFSLINYILKFNVFDPLQKYKYNLLIFLIVTKTWKHFKLLIFNYKQPVFYFQLRFVCVCVNFNDFCCNLYHNIQKSWIILTFVITFEKYCLFITLICLSCFSFCAKRLLDVRRKIYLEES